MKPVDFAESNRTLVAPGIENCEPLRVFTDGVECVSKWKPTFKERIAILFGAPVWMGMQSGETQPPVFLNVEYPFVEPSWRDAIANAIHSYMFGDEPTIDIKPVETTAESHE